MRLFGGRGERRFSGGFGCLAASTPGESSTVLVVGRDWRCEESLGTGRLGAGWLRKLGVLFVGG